MECIRNVFLMLTSKPPELIGLLAVFNFITDMGVASGAMDTAKSVVISKLVTLYIYPRG